MHQSEKLGAFLFEQNDNHLHLQKTIGSTIFIAKLIQ